MRTSSRLARLLGLGLLLASTALRAEVVFEEDFTGDGGMATLGAMQAVSLSSNADWNADSFGGDNYAIMNGFGADTASDDWLITPAIDLGDDTEATLSFVTARNFDGPALKVLVSGDYSGGGTPADVQAATWTELDGFALSSGGFAATPSGPVDISEFTGQGIHVAFQYISTGTGAGDGALWEVLEIGITDEGAGLSASAEADYVADFEQALAREPVQFSVVAQNGTPPYSYAWSFGDGGTAQTAQTTYSYPLVGNYNASVTVTDATGASVEATLPVSVLRPVEAEVPARIGDVRVASFNASLFGNSDGEMLAKLQTTDFARAKAVAEIIQRTRPDVILLNEIDYEPGLAAADALRENYLAVSQNGAEPIRYDYAFAAPSNTGVATGLDLDNNGSAGGPGDAQGFGSFEGQYGMLLLSRLPIVDSEVRSFQNFLWKDMPEARLPQDPDDADGNGDTTSWYTNDELAVLRLSSKSHWDVPVELNGEVIHILASHPTPPVFDGAEDRNGTRNADEIRLWADYVTPGAGAYLVDDAGNAGGLGADERFVLVGDQNADPDEGDGIPGAMNQFLELEQVQGDVAPASAGAVRYGFDADDTLPGVGGLRLDYVSPSTYGLRVEQSGVYWPDLNDPQRRLVGRESGEISSDHRLVWVDLSVLAGPAPTPAPTPGTGGDGGGAFGGLGLLALGTLIVARLRRRGD